MEASINLEDHSHISSVVNRKIIAYNVQTYVFTNVAVALLFRWNETPTG